MFMAGARTSPAGWRTTQTADAAIARSQDGGRNWEVLQGGLPPHLHGDVEAMALEAWNGSCQVFAGTTDGEVFFSEDQGEHWSQIASGLPPISNGCNHLNLLQ